MRKKKRGGERSIEEEREDKGRKIEIGKRRV
jgi:hypothetical protein